MTIWIRIGALLMALAVVIGAFGAHGLKNILSQYSTTIYEKAVFYHFIHALGLLFVAILPSLNLIQNRPAAIICGIFALGILVFSGSLYLLAITEIRWLGAITPIGGLSFIIAWCLLAYQIANRS